MSAGAFIIGGTHGQLLPNVRKRGCVDMSHAEDVSIPAFVGPLDGHTTDLVSAWSVTRRMLASYEGPLLEVAALDESAKQDVSYDANGYLDLAALLAFADGGTIKVTKIYDQTARACHAVSQIEGEGVGGLIVKDGVAVTKNDRVMLEFNESNYAYYLADGSLLPPLESSRSSFAALAGVPRALFGCELGYSATIPAAQYGTIDTSDYSILRAGNGSSYRLLTIPNNSEIFAYGASLLFDIGYGSQYKNGMGLGFNYIGLYDPPVIDSLYPILGGADLNGYFAEACYWKTEQPGALEALGINQVEYFGI